MNDIQDTRYDLYDEPTDEPTDRPTRPVSVSHLVIGLVFLGIAGMWALAAGTGISGPDLTLSGPLVLIAAGVIGLVASIANARRRRHAAYHPDNPYQEQ